MVEPPISMQGGHFEMPGYHWVAAEDDVEENKPSPGEPIVVAPGPKDWPQIPNQINPRKSYADNSPRPDVWMRHVPFLNMFVW
jgi:hypothetical protein